jgi:hypothetical protein
VYPLFVPMAAALGICSYQLVRNITGNPEVRVTKEKRAAGVLDNHDEGERYANHGLRKFVRGKKPEIMASPSSPTLPRTTRRRIGSPGRGTGGQDFISHA